MVGLLNLAAQLASTFSGNASDMRQVCSVMGANAVTGMAAVGQPTARGNPSSAMGAKHSTSVRSWRARSIGPCGARRPGWSGCARRTQDAKEWTQWSGAIACSPSTR